MPKNVKTKTTVKKDVEPEGFYKGYDVNWLRKEPSHPDYYLVEEYDKKGDK